MSYLYINTFYINLQQGLLCKKVTLIKGMINCTINSLVLKNK